MVDAAWWARSIASFTRAVPSPSPCAVRSTPSRASKITGIGLLPADLLSRAGASSWTTEPAANAW
jgi:hypothetical protein